MDNLQIEMSTKEVAEFFGISKDTLRFYEQKGIIPPVSRNNKGYRVYRNYELNLICLALDLKKLGFPLSKIAEVINLFINENDDSLNKQKQMLRDQIEAVKRQIVALEEVSEMLEDKLEKFDAELGSIQTQQRFKTEPLWKNYRR